MLELGWNRAGLRFGATVSIGDCPFHNVEGARLAGPSGLPSTTEMFQWIEKVVAQGIRRPGYPADRWTEEFIFEKFKELGLQSVRFEPVESSFWKDSHARLAVMAHQQGASWVPTMRVFVIAWAVPSARIW